MDVELLRKLNADRALAAEVLFGHRHPQASPEFHVAMVDLWRCASEFVMFEAFREAGKTTKAEEHLVLEGAFGNFHYGLIIGETYSKACQRLEAIDKEARSNARLADLFGGRAVLARRSIENRVWFASGALLEAWGWEQELQSFKYHDWRPDLVYLDDIENKERVRDKVAVDESMRKFWLELLPALDKTRRRIRFGQTRRAEDCMVTRFARNPEWLYFAVPICDGDIDDPVTQSAWEARYPMSWIRRERDRYAAAGMLSEFLQSYMLQAVNPEERAFAEAQLGSLEASGYQWMPRYAIYDPSRTSHERRKGNEAKSDRTGKVVVSRLGSRIIVHESTGAYWKPDEFMADVFATAERHHPAKIGIEKNSLDDWLLQPLRIEMLRRGVLLPLKGLNAPQDRSKEDFILGLQPFAVAGDIVLVGGKLAHPQLVAEWANFPRGTRDVLNALAYALRMFSGVPVYEDFGPSNILEAPRPDAGEVVHVAWNAGPAEVVAVALVASGRRIAVSADWSAVGAPREAVGTVLAGMRSRFPRCELTHWVPADTFDQWQRISLVPALRGERIAPLRAEHATVARGCLSGRIRTVWREAREFTVDRRATLTLNALGAGYAFAAEAGGRLAREPESGVSKLVGEAIECAVASLDAAFEQAAIPKGAHVERTRDGRSYVSAMPGPRGRT